MLPSAETPSLAATVRGCLCLLVYYVVFVPCWNSFLGAEAFTKASFSSFVLRNELEDVVGESSVTTVGNLDDRGA